MHQEKRPGVVRPENSQGAPAALFFFNGLEQCPEIAFAEGFGALALDDFKKHRAECQRDERKQKRRKNLLVY